MNESTEIRDGLHRLWDQVDEDVLQMSDAEVLALSSKMYGDPDALADRFSVAVRRAMKNSRQADGHADAVEVTQSTWKTHIAPRSLWLFGGFASVRQQGALRTAFSRGMIAAAICFGAVSSALVLTRSIREPHVDNQDFSNGTIQASTALTKGDLGSALDEIERLLRAKPDNPLLINMKGAVYRARFFNKAALAQFELAYSLLKQQPADTDNLKLMAYVNNNIGLLEYEAGDLDASVASYNAALSGGRFFTALDYRGKALLSQRKYASAISDFVAALSIEDNYRTVEDLLSAYQGSANYDGQLAAFAVLLAKEPSSWWLLEQRSSVYEKLGQIDLAIEDLKNAYSLTGTTKYADKIRQLKAEKLRRARPSVQKDERDGGARPAAGIPSVENDKRPGAKPAAAVTSDELKPDTSGLCDGLLLNKAECTFK